MEEENVKIIYMMKKTERIMWKNQCQKKSMIKCRRSNKSTIKCWKKSTLVLRLFDLNSSFIPLHLVTFSVTLFFREKKKDVWSTFLLYNSNSPFWACSVQRLLSSPLNTESRLKKEIKFDLTRWRSKLVSKCKCWLELHKTISFFFHRHQIQKNMIKQQNHTRRHISFSSTIVTSSSVP